MEIQCLVALIKELQPNLRCKYVRGDDYCTFLNIDESEPRVYSLTPLGENHSIAGSYLEKLANGIEPYSPFNISQLMNNSGSNRPIIETIVAHTAEFYWVQVDRARYVVWIPNERHTPGELTEWTEIDNLEGLRANYLAQLPRQRNTRLSSSNNSSICEYANLLLAKHNLVLTGAPGTGKTYTAKAIAAYIISEGKVDWRGLSAEQKEQVAFVQFHPSYDYTDFVEGLRPGENGEFRRQDGIFKEFCKRALGDEDVVSEVSTNLFDKVYNELIDDIRSGAITTYERITADDRGLAVNDKNKIIFGPEVKNYKTASIRNLRLLFDYYQAKGIKDASSLTRDDLWKAISSLTGGKTKTLDYTEYRWALNQLLSRVTDADKALAEAEPAIQKENITKKPFIFIIDEINRGELSKIFGELFYAIEPDYRGEEGTVQTQYNNLVEDDDIFKSGFYVPENVYIIGTMNDVDRGVEAMDFAIRRRFGWKEVTAEESAENMCITGLARVKMDALNKSLLAHNLTKAHCIGGAYFRKLEGDDFNALWDYHLEGIIFEYFRGEPDAQKAIEEIKEDYLDAKLPEPAPKVEESVSTEDGSAE